MAIELRQQAFATKDSRSGRSATAVFDQPTIKHNFLFVAGATTSESASLTITDSNFVKIRERIQGDLKVAIWYYENANATSSVTMRISRSRPFLFRVLEYSGVRQGSSLDRSASFGRSDRDCDSGTTGTSTQAESLVLGVIANEFASCRQFGFSGGLSRLFDEVTPDDDFDSDRVRLSVHQFIASSTSSWRLRAKLSSHRNWGAIIAVFKGASTGPRRMASTKTDDDHKTVKTRGRGVLTAFGPLKSTLTTPATVSITGSGSMWPFEYQYWLNNRGLVIGNGTDYRVLSVEGLEGWQMRVSDEDLPFDDGAVRGTDLMAPRIITFNLGMIPTGGSVTEVEAALSNLWDQLVPQKNQDWELVWRHPGRGVWMVRCRPIELIRGHDARRVLFQDQKFMLRAADPKHYSPVLYGVGLTVSTATTTVLNQISSTGNAPLYPYIELKAGQALTRVQLGNVTTGQVLDVRTAIPSGSTLIADMPARITAAGTSVITVDGVSKYGAWQPPREPFRLDPHPSAEDGVNEIYLITEPAGATVTCNFFLRPTRYG